jgi:serine protease Do
MSESVRAKCQLQAVFFILICAIRLASISQSAEARPKSTEEIIERARDSVVVITQRARDGSIEGIGSGFVINKNGLIATSLHVIGEGRPIEIAFANGDKFPVTEIHASDRKLDLALIRVAATNLPAFRLADSDELKQGAPVIAIGNPRGLTHSAVQGIVSAFREFEHGKMIQLAIPIEPGNSGGPLLDANGRVIGILEMKSAVTENLGFATPINALKTLLEKPNPVPIENWIKLGALDTHKWKPAYGAHWTRRAGELRVTGAGTGFGGRSLCFYQTAPLALPYELSVTVKLDDESGAAGLIFATDGADQHYGFYPSAGQLRLTRFDGPDVFSWKILEQKSSTAYRTNDWNTLRVLFSTNSIQCYVNDQLAIESHDDALRSGGVGLAKFRQTSAQFKNFKVSPLERRAPRVESQIPRSQPNTRASLLTQAAQLESQAAALRKKADTLHAREIQTELTAELAKAESEIDLFKSALLIACLDNPDLEIASYQEELASMAAEISHSLPSAATSEQKLDHLINYLFKENGYHGSRSDYYNRANSYINEVIDDREGIPITLSILFMELAHRIGLETSGIPLPGHFIVAYNPRAKNSKESKYIDVFEAGRVGDREQATEWAQEHSELPILPEHFRPATKKDMIVRMLRNLLALADPAEKPAQALNYIEIIMSIDSEQPADRWRRAFLLIQTGDPQSAKTDLQWLLDKKPNGVNLDRVEQLLNSL